LEGLRDMLFNIFRKEWDRTFAAQKNQCADWTEFHNHWIDLMKSIIAIVPRDVQLQSLTAIRFLEFNRDILWSFFTTMVGSYETSIRELRFWLEAMLQAHLIDRNGGLPRMSKRIEKMTGSRLIRACGFGAPYQSELMRIYKQLCKYVHPTREELNLESKDVRVTFFYDKDSFKRNRILHRSTYDAILFIVMITFPDAAKQYVQKHLVMESLQDLEYILSTRYITEILNQM
jgi:hypothetical protein